ncbi:hypothetical protein GFK32_25315, partial [Salmonella enterica subsp. enterica serovar Enteritidis]|nr:hypothetical protein [Salmonella enterica subsp. enterica serovar Enteritidis]
MLALGFTFFLSGCDYFADKHLVEEMKEQQKEQETKINLLEKQQKEQEAKINLLEKQQATIINHVILPVNMRDQMMRNLPP